MLSLIVSLCVPNFRMVTKSVQFRRNLELCRRTITAIINHTRAVDKTRNMEHSGTPRNTACANNAIHCFRPILITTTTAPQLTVFSQRIRYYSQSFTWYFGSSICKIDWKSVFFCFGLFLRRRKHPLAYPRKPRASKGHGKLPRASPFPFSFPSPPSFFSRSSLSLPLPFPFKALGFRGCRWRSMLCNFSSCCADGIQLFRTHDQFVPSRRFVTNLGWFVPNPLDNSYLGHHS